MCSALHYKSFLMHGIQTLLKPLRWSSLLFPLPPSYFHHSISTMLFQNSLRLRKDKRSTKKSIFSRQNIFIVTFWKCFEWVQPGNHFKGILFLLQNSFRMNWFLLRLVVSVLGCCNWYGTLCMAALLDFFCNLYNYNCHTWAIVTCSIDWNHLISFCFMFSNECIRSFLICKKTRTYPIQTYLYFSTYSLFQRWYFVTVTWLVGTNG